MMSKEDVLELAEMRGQAEFPWELWPVAKELEREGRAMIAPVVGAGGGWVRVTPLAGIVEQQSTMDT